MLSLRLIVRNFHPAARRGSGRQKCIWKGDRVGTWDQRFESLSSSGESAKVSVPLPWSPRPRAKCLPKLSAAILKEKRVDIRCKICHLVFELREDADVAANASS
jgi:hypothetical protein